MEDVEATHSRSLLEGDPREAHIPFLDVESRKPSVGFTIFSVFVAALGALSFGFSLGYTSPALPEMVSDLGLSTTQKSVFSSIINVGAMVGAILIGKLSDYFGRRNTFVIAGIPTIVGWLIIGLFSNIYILYLGRFLTGFGSGAYSFSVPVYIAEISPENLRGGLGAINQLAVTIGILLVYFFGIYFEWRTLAFAGLAPPVLLLLGYFLIPETPRWLVMKGFEEKAYQSLEILRGKNDEIKLELDGIVASLEAMKSEPSATFSDLLKPNLTRPLTIGVVLMLLQQFSGINAVMFYASSIFEEAGYTNANLPSFGLQVVQVIATGVCVSLMDKAGRVYLLSLSSISMGLSIFTLGIAFYLADTDLNSTYSSILALGSLIIYIIGFSLGMGAVPWIIMSEIFPSHVRGVAGSFAVFINWMASFIVTLTYGYLLDWSSIGTFWIYAAVCFAGSAFIRFQLPETKGRTLEEIEEAFRHRRH